MLMQSSLCSRRSHHFPRADDLSNFKLEEWVAVALLNAIFYKISWKFSSTIFFFGSRAPSLVALAKSEDDGDIEESGMG